MHLPYSLFVAKLSHRRSRNKCLLSEQELNRRLLSAGFNEVALLALLKDDWSVREAWHEYFQCISKEAPVVVGTDRDVISDNLTSGRPVLVCPLAINISRRLCR